MRMMKDALDKENLRPFLMIQALGFHVPEVENQKGGYHELPEFPYCMFCFYLKKLKTIIQLIFKILTRFD